MREHDAGAAAPDGTGDPGVAVRLPGWAWPLALYAALWCALAPFHRHATVSVETDFPRYAALAHLGATYDPFTPVGYPRLLAWTRDLVGDTFRAGVLLSFLGGAGVLVAAHALARRLVGPRSAAYATVLLALNWLFLQNGLLAGTDALWTAVVLASIHVLLTARDRGSRDLHGLAGALLGVSLTLRFATLGVLPWIVLATLLGPRGTAFRERAGRAALLLFATALGALPQLWVAARDAGNPFASGQAANVWFGIFGNRDWPGRWSEVPRDLGLLDVVRDHPGAFAANLAANLGRAALHVFTSPFGLAPAGLGRKPETAIVAGALVVLGVAAAWRGGVAARLGDAIRAARRSDGLRTAGLAALGYAASVSCAFWMTRFFLPLLVLVVLCGAALLRRVLWPALAGRRALRAGLVLAAPVLLGGHAVDTWFRFLRTSQQPVEEVGTALTASGIREHDVVAATVCSHYAEILPFRFEEVPLAVRDLEDLQLALARAGAAYFLHEERRGPEGAYHPELDRLLSEPDLAPYLEPLWLRREFPRAALFRAR